MTTRLLPRLLVTTGLLTASVTSASALVLSEEERTALGLTLYQHNLAQVDEQRSIPALPAASPVHLTGVSPLMLPETLQISGAGSLLEQSLQQNTLELNQLLQQQIGKTIQLKRFNPATGIDSERRVRLLRVQGQILLIENEQDQMETLPIHNGQWRLAVTPDAPYALKPRLTFQTRGTDNKGTAQLRYLTRGLSWSMDYVLSLDAEGQQLDLQGLASIQNDTDQHWPSATIKLLAGEVHEPEPGYRMEQVQFMARAAKADTAGGASRSSIQDYHLYTLPQPLSLGPQERKQVPLIQQDGISADIRYQQHLQISTHQQAPVEGATPNIVLRFEAPAVRDSKTPLPAGQVRVFRPDTEGQPQFVGGSRLDATAAGDEAEVLLGQAFDLEVEYVQTAFRKVYNGYEVSYTVTLHNRAETSRSFELNAQAPLPFNLIESELAPANTYASGLQWLLELPAQSSRTLSFSLELIRP